MASIQSALIRFFIRRSNIWNRPLPEIRKSMESMKTKGFPAGVSMENIDVKGVSCALLSPRTAKKGKAVLYFHGGGFCLGVYPANLEFVAEVAKMCGVDVYMPDYRLAPENPFPAALEDAMAVYKGMLMSGYDAEDLLIMGDSSGCALALSALLVLKRSGVEMPKALAFMTPVFDLAGTGETFLTKAVKDPFQMKDPLGIAKIYCGPNNPSSPVLSPLYGELDGLPPALVHAGDYDVFSSDACRFAEKMKASGGEANLKVWKKMWHIFHMQASFVPESKKALDELCSFIRGSLGEIENGQF